jgi:glycosyltransferase involved in cell wall biosynthesis
MDPVSGGPCQGIRNLNKAMEEKGIYREVACLDDPGSSFLGSDPFITHALGPTKSAWQYSPRLLPWLTKNINRFDIVIINGIWLYHVFAASRALRMLKRNRNANESIKIPKLFIMPHGMLDPYFQKAPDRKLKAFRNWLYWKLIESKNINQASGLLFTCQTELQLAAQSFSIYKPNKEINVGYGVEDAPLYTEEMKKAFLEKCPGLIERPFFLFLSRIHSKKGVDHLVTAYIQLFLQNKVRRGYKFPVLVIAGPGMETSYGKGLEDLIARFPEVQSSILFPGMLTGQAKWGALYGCEAFVLPSHQENFGIAVVEALACKKAVLISNQINIWREIITDGGGIVKDDTLDGTRALLNCWIRLTAEEKLIMAQKGRASFERNFAVAPAADRFIEALKTA